MSYDLAVWDGPVPGDDRAAAQEYVRRVEAHPDGRPATPRVRAVVEALTARFPDLTDLGDEELDGTGTPWASGPLISEASGDFLYVPLTFSGAQAHLDEVVQVVHAHGLVCFDPQSEQVLPRPSRRPVREVRPRRNAAVRAQVLRLPVLFVALLLLLAVLDRCSG